MCIALNADIRTCSIGTAADTGAVRTAAGNDLTTGDLDIGSAGSVTGSTAADRGRLMATACHQLAGVPVNGISVFILVLGSTIIILIVRDGQGAFAVFVRFFDGGVFFLPIVLNQNGIIAVQLKFGIAVALYFDRTGLGFSSVNSNVHILQGHIGGVALLFGGNGDGVGSGLGLAGGLVFGDQDDFGIRTMVDVVAILILHKGAFVLIRPLGDGLATIFGHDLHTAFCYIVFCCKRRCGDGRDHCHQSRCGQHPQGKLFFHIFPHCKTLQTKNLQRRERYRERCRERYRKPAKNRNFGAEKHIAVHFHARRLFVAQV